ncbi:putative gustatory receptor 28b [Neodiprion lecontei]|uniref:Gustatory receptor n=2 Tax=Neodiprion TaxID=270857 RepID=A0ABM3GNX4_NEOLC|nr:putative gustatory receptor 28b [Neodiprion lecontei]
MFFTEPKNFYEAIKPLSYFNWFVGLGVFRKPNQSNLSFLYMRLQMVIFNLINWTMVYTGLIIVMQTEDTINDGPPMARTMYRVLICANSCLVVLAPLSAWLQLKEVKRVILQMESLDVTLQTTLGIKTNYKGIYIRLNCEVIVGVLFMFAVSIVDFLVSPSYGQSLMTVLSVSATQHQPIIAIFLLGLNFCTSLRYVKSKFRDLNNGLQELAAGQSATSCYSSEKLFVTSQNIANTISIGGIKKVQVKSLKNDQLRLLREIRKIHWELSKLAIKINSVYGVQNLIIMGLSFVMITGLLYTIYCTVMWESATIETFRNIIPSTTWAIIYAFQIVVISHSCWSTTNEAQRTGEVIYEFFIPKLQDENMQKEIQEFSVQMLQNPVRFNACGFFDMDYTYIQGVIGSVTTYLVILIQMSQLSQSSTSNPPANETGG